MSETFALGDFVLTSPIGRGGMAEVWAGTHARSLAPGGQPVAVAVKVVGTSAKRVPLGQHHLRNEVRAMAQLDHPGVIVVYDYGEVTKNEAERAGGVVNPGSPYLVMELADRGTAREKCGAVEWDESRMILLSLLDALAHAHARGVLHRDVKPSNVLLFGDGSVKLTDFGLARHLDPEEADGETKGGGTPAYMAPEQFQSAWREYDCATDLYAVGCVAYALACGKPPYGSYMDIKLMSRLHQSGVLPALEPKMPIPDGLETWVRRLLQKNPGRRYQRAADAAAALLRLGPANRRPIYARDSSPGARASVAPMSLYTLSDQETVTSFDDDEGDVDDEPTARDSIISIAPEPLVHQSWERPKLARAALDRVCAGLGLYGMRAIPLVARKAERDALWNALKNTAYSFEPHLMLLDGPPGCGKSRLAQWLCERAHETGAGIVMEARHSPRAGPGHGLTPMLARHLRVRGLSRPEMRAHLTGLLARAGVDDDAEVDALTDLLAEARDGRHGRVTTAGERYVMLERFIARASGRRVVVLWLDDVQWSLDTLAFVEHLMQSSRARVLILMTTRDESSGDRAAEREILERCMAHPRAKRIDVGPLGARDWRGLIDKLLLLEGSLADEVAARTAGNPLFAVQLVGDWVERRELVAGDTGFALRRELPMPARLDDIWAARLDRFLDGRSAEERMALELAATLGQDVDGREWRDACGLAGISASLAIVEELIARRLATTGPRGPQIGWAFVHTMLRDAVEATATREGRSAQHHRTCAEMLRSRPATPGRLGRHLLTAGDQLGAIEPLRLAARQRIDGGEYAAAERLLDERDAALASLALADDDARWGEGWLLRCRLAEKRGAFDAGLMFAERAEHAAGQHDWPRVLVEALLLRAQIQRMRGQTQQAEEALRRAQAGARAIAASDLLADGQELLGRLLIHQGKLDEADVCWREAEALYRELDDIAGAASTTWQRGHAATYAQKYDEATALNESALSDLERCGDRWGVARCLNMRGEIARLTGNLPLAERAYRAAQAVLQGIGATDSATICASNVARVMVERGRYHDAREQLERGVLHFETAGRKNPLAWVQTVLLCCLAAQREWASWDQRIESVTQLLAESGFVDLDIARSAQMAGDVALAAGERARAARVYRIAAAQWGAVGRATERALVEALIAELG